MPTTIHVSASALKAVDQRAKTLGVSRNKFIVRALEQALSRDGTWSPEFLGRVRRVDPDMGAAVDEMLIGARSGRRFKLRHGP